MNTTIEKKRDILRNYEIKTPGRVYPVSVKAYSEALSIANHILWSNGLQWEEVDIVPKKGKV